MNNPKRLKLLGVFWVLQFLLLLTACQGQPSLSFTNRVMTFAKPPPLPPEQLTNSAPLLSQLHRAQANTAVSNSTGTVNSLAFQKRSIQQTHKVQVSDATLASQIEANGGQLISDYGSYKLYQITNFTAGLLNHPRTELRDHYNMITLHAGHMDTRQAAIQGLRRPVSNFSGRHLHLVQFAGPVRPEWRAELLACGAQIVSYIPENSYLIYGNFQTLSNIQALASAPHIQWEGRYREDYKIHPAAKSTDAFGNPRDIGTDLFEVQLVADDASNTGTVQLISGLALSPIKRQERMMQYLNVLVELNASDLKTVSAQPDVVAILPYFPRRKLDESQDQIVAGNLTGDVPTGPGYLAWLKGLGFNETQFTNFVVDISDSGVDNGTTLPGHFGLYVDGEVTNASRIVYSRFEQTRTYGNDSLQGCDGHGNINAHIIGGFDDYSNFPFADTNGFHYGLGVCPFVSMGVSVIFDSADEDDFYYPVFNNLQSEAYHNGVRISNNSWGTRNSIGIYDTEAQNFDALVRDAQPTNSTYCVDGNQEMVIVFAAGNDGSSAQTIDTPGSAKNVITVGGADGVQLFGGPDRSGVDDDQASSANEIGSFSSRGPCADGRIKPDIMAPSTHISGGVFQETNDFATYPYGIAGACFDGSDNSGGPGGSIYWPLDQQFYTASSGTSHSTPCVSGGCALIMQYFLNNFSTNLPSPAMTKAYLMNSARYMTGVTASDTLPSNNQGMGEMNLGTAFDGVPRILRDQLDSDTFTNSGDIRAVTGVIVNTNKPFCVTLAWTDAFGSLSGNAYNNNLDLVVVMGTNTYKGNVFSNNYSVTGGSADMEDNVESVILPPGTFGNFVVLVNGTSINSIGVPNTNNTLNQDFALVVYNANSVSMPVITPAGETLISEGCIPTNGVIDPGETVTVNFALQNIGTVGTSNLTATLLTNSEVFDASPAQNYGVLPAASAPVSLPFTFTAGGVCGGNITATLLLHDGTNNFGTVSYTLSLGQFINTTTFTENFDEVVAPALPANWTTDASDAQTLWATSTNAYDTASNAMFVAENTNSVLSELFTPNIPILTSSAQLMFMNYYDLESYPSESPSPSTAFDGGVLEIQINGGGFTDILQAGGSFVTGGYTCAVDPGDDSPLQGRAVWSGNSGGFIQTIVNLPASAAGQTIQLKWACGTDSGNSGGGTGWYIDSISILDGYYQCCTPMIPPTILNPKVIGTNMTFSFETTLGQPYSVQYTTNLNNASWTTFQSVAGDGSTVSITNGLCSPGRFYRIRTP